MKFKILSNKKSCILGLVSVCIHLAPASAGAQEDMAESDPLPLNESEQAETDRHSDESLEQNTPAEVDEEAGTLSATSSDDSVVVESGGGLFESATSAEEATTEEALSLQWSGYVRGDAFVGTVPGSEAGSREIGINAAYGEVSLQPLVKTGSWGSAFADFRMRYGQQLDQNALFLDLREAYASAYLGPVELRFGKQIVVWGRADGFNPTSNISPVDFRIRSPIEDDRRVGTVGARGFLTLSPFKLEAVWMPLYVPTMYPTFDIEDTVTSFVDPNFPTLSLRNSLVAGRLHLELSAFDASVSYLYGNAPLPGIALESFLVGSPATGGANAERGYIHIQRRAYIQHVIGADFSTTVSDWFGLRGEAAYRRPVNYENKPWAARPDAQWVLGIDREFGPVSIIAQYLGRYTFDWEPRRPEDNRGAEGILTLNPQNPDDVAQAQTAIDNQLFNTNRTLFNQLYQLQTLASVRVEWKTLHETLSLSALGLYNFNTEEWLLFPKVGYQIGGGLTAYAGAEIYSGKRGTLMDLIDEKLTAGYVELRASF